MFSRVDEPGVYIVDRDGDEVELPLTDAVSAITSYRPRLQGSLIPDDAEVPEDTNLTVGSIRRRSCGMTTTGA